MLSSCEKDGLKVSKSAIIEATKKVCNMLQIANSGNKKISESVVSSPSSKIKKWEELTSFKKSRSQSETMIAAVSCDVSVFLSVPYLILNSTDLNEANFSGEFAKILLEPESCIVFTSKELSDTGSSRLALLLRDLKTCFDGRLLVFIHIESYVPASLSEYVEKVFENQRKRKADDTAAAEVSKELKLDVEDCTSHEELEFEKDKEIRIAEETIKELKELIIRNEAKYEVKIALIDEEVKKKQSNLQDKINSQQSENTMLLDRLNSQDHEIEILEEKSSNNLHEIDVLEEKNRKQHRAIDVLEEKNGKQRKEIAVLVEMNKKHVADNEVLEESNRKKLEQTLVLEDVIREKLKEISVKEEEMKHLQETVILEDKNEGNSKEVETQRIEENSSSDKVECAKLAEANPNSDSRLDHYKMKMKKHSHNSKLSPKEIVYRTFRNIKVTESVITNSEKEYVCNLNVTKDSSKILLERKFTATGPTRQKSIISAYSSILSY